MVGSSGGKMIINSGMWYCGVCGKGVQQTQLSAQYEKKDSHAVQWCAWLLVAGKSGPHCWGREGSTLFAQQLVSAVTTHTK